MREIEFRAWDVEEKCWIPSELIALTHDGKLITCDDIYSPWVNEVIPVDVTFYTGLSDKNGKKIFEGDIVQESYVNPLNDSTVFEKYIVERTISTLYKMKHVSGKSERDRYLWMRYSNTEVIGSIYENSDLIKQ